MNPTGGAPPPGGEPPGGGLPPGSGDGGAPPGPFGPPPEGFGPPQGFGSAGGYPATGGGSFPGGGPRIHPHASASLACALGAYPASCCCYLGIPMGIAAVVLGALALQKINENPEEFSGTGTAITGIVVGAFALLGTVAMIAFGLSQHLARRLLR